MKTLQFFLVVLANAKNRFSFMAGIKRLPPLNILNNISSKTEEKWKAVQSCSKDLPASWSSASECLTEVKSETSYFNLLNCRPAVRRRVPGIISGAAALTWREESYSKHRSLQESVTLCSAWCCDTYYKGNISFSDIYWLSQRPTACCALK